MVSMRPTALTSHREVWPGQRDRSHHSTLPVRRLAPLQSGGGLLHSPGRRCLLLEIEVDKLLGQILELLQIAGLINHTLKTLLLELLMESDFHGMFTN